MKEFDVVVWGATGFTGRLVAEYLAETYGTGMDQLSWAVAGRSEAKLRSVAEEFGFSEVPRLVADSMHEASIRAMAVRARVICSTVGPYALYGEPLVKICAEMGLTWACIFCKRPFWTGLLARPMRFIIG